MLQSMTPSQQLRAGKLPRRLIQLFVGLSLFGVGNALMMRANCGMDPWNVLHQGIVKHTPLTMGSTIVIVGLLVLLAWIPLKQWPGVGTIANAVWIGIATDAMLTITPDIGHPALRGLAIVAGILIAGLSIAMYIGSQLGPGPRDGLMTGLSARTGLSIRLVRTGLEVTVLLLGILLGGTFGITTVAFALTIGPIAQFLLPYCIVTVDAPEPAAKKTQNP